MFVVNFYVLSENFSALLQLWNFIFYLTLSVSQSRMHLERISDDLFAQFSSENISCSRSRISKYYIKRSLIAIYLQGVILDSFFPFRLLSAVQQLAFEQTFCSSLCRYLSNILSYFIYVEILIEVNAQKIFDTLLNCTFISNFYCFHILYIFYLKQKDSVDINFIHDSISIP